MSSLYIFHFLTHFCHPCFFCFNCFSSYLSMQFPIFVLIFVFVLPFQTTMPTNLGSDSVICFLVFDFVSNVISTLCFAWWFLFSLTSLKILSFHLKVNFRPIGVQEPWRSCRSWDPNLKFRNPPFMLTSFPNLYFGVLGFLSLLWIFWFFLFSLTWHSSNQLTDPTFLY